MLLPFINVTIKSIIWYQGENNIFEDVDGGHISNNTGYACMERLMLNQWRKIGVLYQ